MPERQPEFRRDICRGKQRELNLIMFSVLELIIGRVSSQLSRQCQSCHIRWGQIPLMCWAEKASQPGCILLVGWNHMSTWMQFAKRLIPPTSKSVFLDCIPDITSIYRKGLFCSWERRMCCLYVRAKQNNVPCSKYLVTYTWSLCHPHVSARAPAGISPSHEMHRTECISWPERKNGSCSIVDWIIWQQVPLWICAREHFCFVDGCEE